MEHEPLPANTLNGAVSEAREPEQLENIVTASTERRIFAIWTGSLDAILKLHSSQCFKLG